MAGTKTESRLEVLLQAIRDLPTIPETLIRILNTLDDPDSSVENLASIIRVDPPLSAKILRLANSPYYDGGGDLTDIGECISVLGFSTVREVALCVMLADTLMQACRRNELQFDYRGLWRHSVHTAVLARRLAQRVGDPDPGEVFTMGLLHDLGKFVQLLHEPLLFAEVLRRWTDSNRRLADVEKEVLGYDHAEAGGAFAEAWSFPSSVVAAIGAHHGAVSGEGLSARDGRVLQVISLANVLAHDLSTETLELGQGSDPGESVPLARALDLEDVLQAERQEWTDEMEREAQWLAG